VLNVFGITGKTWIDESFVFHVDHIFPMSSQVSAKMILKHEKLFFKLVLRLHSLLMFDGLLPHPHELPLLEFLEEI